MRFSNTNLCTESATVVTASSSNVNFPVSNLKDSPFRSKRWRSSGTFVIDATNNKINFKESGGGLELTATLTSGTYSPLALAAEIKTRMGLAGVSIYTVTYSTTTGLWTISTSGAFLSLLNLTGTNQATSVLKVTLGFPSADKTSALTYTGSLIAIHTKESIVFDLITAQNIQNIAIMWPGEDGIRLSNTAVLKIEANATNVWTAPAVSQTLTIDNNYVRTTHCFVTSQSYRYWRVTIQDPRNPYLYVELGVVWIGEDIGFSSPENGFKYKLVDQSVISKTPFGHEYVDEYPQQAQLEFDYKYIYYTDYQLLENTFRDNGSRKPVLVIFDNDELVFNKNHFVIYGKLEKSFSGDHVSLNLFNGGFKITELG